MSRERFRFLLPAADSPAGGAGYGQAYEVAAGQAHTWRNSGQLPLLQVAASTPLWRMYLAGPPIPIQHLMLAALRPLAHARGHRARYPRFEDPARGR